MPTNQCSMIRLRSQPLIQSNTLDVSEISSSGSSLKTLEKTINLTFAHDQDPTKLKGFLLFFVRIFFSYIEIFVNFIIYLTKSIQSREKLILL